MFVRVHVHLRISCVHGLCMCRVRGVIRVIRVRGIRVYRVYRRGRSWGEHM